MGIRFLFILSFLAFVMGACAPESKGTKIRNGLTNYQNPETGKVVTLRPAIAKSLSASRIDEAFVLENVTLQIPRGTKKVHVTVDKKSANSVDKIELEGQLDEESRTAVLHDKKSDGGSRLKAIASCVLPDDCSEMYVNIYFKLNGEMRIKQFVVLMDDAYAKQKAEGRQDTIEKLKAKQKKKEVPEKGPTKNEKEAEAITASFDDLSDDHGDEGSDPEQEGLFVGPKIPENFEKELKDNVIDEVKTYQAQEKLVQDEKKKAASSAKNIVELNFSKGAVAFGRTNRGKILNSVSALDDAGAGFKRVTNDNFKYGSGFTIDFIKSVAKYHIENGGCGNIIINDIGKKNGGKFSVHSSHQNGQDVDISFLPNDSFQSVVTGKSMVKNFNYECNWKFWDLMISQKLPDGDSAVARILVNPVIKANYCKWAKANNRLESGKEILRRLTPWPEHKKHFHVRMQCSPEHENCQKIVEPPETTGC